MVMFLVHVHRTLLLLQLIRVRLLLLQQLIRVRWQLLLPMILVLRMCT